MCHVVARPVQACRTTTQILSKPWYKWTKTDHLHRPAENALNDWIYLQPTKQMHPESMNSRYSTRCTHDHIHLDQVCCFEDNYPKNRNSFLVKNNNIITTHPNCTPKQCKNIYTYFGLSFKISFIQLIPKHSYDVSWRGRLNVTGTIGQTRRTKVQKTRCA
jgi:hypothetical protein